MAKASADSIRRVSGNIFGRIRDSFTTQATPPASFLGVSGRRRFTEAIEPDEALGVETLWRSRAMPYALFCNDAKLSRTYPTEADVWKFARRSGLVVDVASEVEKPHPRPVLDNDYEIRPCRPEPEEDPDRNKADADREAQIEFRLNG